VLWAGTSKQGTTTTSLIFLAVLKALGSKVNYPILTKESLYINNIGLN
jgi:hypothetical protein